MLLVEIHGIHNNVTLTRSSQVLNGNWTPQVTFNKGLKFPNGEAMRDFNQLYWRSRVVFNPLSTSDDRVNHIVVYSRNFNQALQKVKKNREITEFTLCCFSLLNVKKFVKLYCVKWKIKTKSKKLAKSSRESINANIYWH